MSAELNELLETLLGIAVRQAARIPSPSDPASDHMEREADDYILELARTNTVPLPSPRVACALIPRLTVARHLGSLVEAAFARHAELGDAATGESDLLRHLLVTTWHSSWKSRWLAGDFSPPPPSKTS